MAAIAIHSHTSTLVLLSLSLILFAGFFATRVTKLFRLPNVSGYIIAGMLIGPGMLHIIPEATIENLSFISDVALAFIAFDVGRFFKKEVICGSGTKVVVITIFEALVAGVAVSVAMRFMFSFSWDFSLLLGAIATATAPASTLMTINQYGAKGEFVNTLLQVVAFDDAVCLFAFTLATAFIGISGNEGKGLVNLLAPLFFNILALVLGFLSGLVLKRMITEKRSNENRLILVIAFLLAISGICVILNVSPLLSCMLFGAVYINLTDDMELYRQINNFSPPIMSTFFIYSGMSLDLGSLKAFGAAGVVYFLIRIAGKYAGAYAGCALTGSACKVKSLLGLALIPQAGVAIGLAFLAQRILPPDMGDMLLTIILASSVLYELAGPGAAKCALVLSGEIPSPHRKE